ncbi:hypothetical protein N9789_00685 [bacterium]|nr:hypothetical protein [Polaribacter sp.]MDA9093251.1 hypothetical protein [Polaribacter sp.]MDB4009713.1 hypothetical protein [Polaribacter sp.]MDB4181155.1 hypothetical protein [Polaribacter sp.]MDB4216674.1 hypothetical protein [bacterium]
MGDAKNFPGFLSDLMVKWLDFFERETVDKITYLGLFTWKDTASKKNAKKKVLLDANNKIFIRTLPFEYSIYFNEISESCLQVLIIQDLEIGVKRKAFEYYYSDETFSKERKELL